MKKVKFLIHPIVSFINIGFKQGKKMQSYKRYLVMLDNLKLKLKKNIEEILKEFFKNVEILIYIYRKKIGPNIYEIPMYLNRKKRLKKGFLAFFKVVKKRLGHSLTERIVFEIIDILSGKSSTLDIKNSIYFTALEAKSNTRFLQNYNKYKVLRYLIKSTKLRRKYYVYRNNSYLTDLVQKEKKFKFHYKKIFIPKILKKVNTKVPSLKFIKPKIFGNINMFLSKHKRKSVKVLRKIIGRNLRLKNVFIKKTLGDDNTHVDDQKDSIGTKLVSKRSIEPVYSLDPLVSKFKNITYTEGKMDLYPRFKFKDLGSSLKNNKRRFHKRIDFNKKK